MPDPTTHARSGSSFPPGFTVFAALVTGGFFFTASVLFPGTDQTGVYLPPDGPPPYPAKPGFGDPVTPNLTPNIEATLATLGLLTEKFPDLAKIGFPQFVTSAPPNTELFGFAHRQVLDATMAEIPPLPQQMVPAASPPETLPPSAGGGGGLAPTPQTLPVPNLEIPPVANLEIPPAPTPNSPESSGIAQLPVIPQLPGTPRVDQQSTQQESAQNSQNGSSGTSQTGSTGTSSGAASPGGSGDGSTKSDDGPTGSRNPPTDSGQGSQGSDHGSQGSGHGSQGSGRSGGED